MWSTHASESSMDKILGAQNQRLSAGSHKVSRIDHLHRETEMIQVEDHLSLLSAQYLVHCMDTENFCHHGHGHYFHYCCNGEKQLLDHQIIHLHICIYFERKISFF